MGSFHNAVNGLVAHIRTQTKLPEYQNIWVVESSRIQFQPREGLPPIMTFKRSEIHDIKDFENRYAEIKESGVPWINLNCYGFLPGAMLIGVEVSTSEHCCPPDKVEIRYSGPPLSIDGRPLWYVFDRLQMTD